MKFGVVRGFRAYVWVELGIERDFRVHRWVEFDGQR